MNKNYGFIMIKPSGQRYINEIYECIQKDFNVLDVYYIGDWKNLAKELYAPEIKEYGKEFAEDFEIHLWINNYFFGNEALLLKVATKANLELEEVLLNIFNKKKEIRRIFNCTKNGTCMFLVNVHLLNIDNLINETNGNVYLEQNGNYTELDKEYLKHDGRYKTQFLNYVHACNPTIADFTYEKNTYEKFRIFNNKLSQQEIENCLKMKSNSRLL